MKLIAPFNLLSEKSILFLAHLVILLYYLPYFLLGEDSNILIHDNLDSNVTWVKILLNNNAVFVSPSTNINQVLKGIQVSLIYGTYDISLIIFNWFGVYFGYVINKIIISIIGFWGMFLLLRNHFFTPSKFNYILTGTSLIFALLPFWSFSASVLGLPFILFAFLNFRNYNINFYNYFIIVIFGFYSSLILSGLFVLIILTIIFFSDVLKKRLMNWSFLLGLILLSIIYLISHFPIIYGFIFDDFLTHRLEFHKGLIGFKVAFLRAVNIFMEGQYHAHSIHLLFVLPVTIIIIVWHRSFNKKIKLILFFIIFTSLFYGFQNHSLLKAVIVNITNIIPIQLQRFHFLHPMFWYILLAVVLSWVSKKNNNLKVIVFVFLVLQLIYVFRQHEIWVNRKEPTFKEFYSEKTFEIIKDIINKPIDSYKVVSVGVHPAVAQYSGFYTLDGYFPSYPLAYKQEFRKVIRNELARNKQLKSYFDNWGSRCYAFSSEIGRDFISNNKKPINYLDYDFQQLKKMKCEYVFSATLINESLNPKLHLIKVVNYPGDYWSIYLYKIL